jgi:ubiquinone/menaquinone biosynthesis C-methylase UbiE
MAFTGMNHQTGRTNYLTRFIAIYKNTPSLAIWRAVEAQAFDNIVFEPPILDLACGTGHFARMLLRNAAITGCDLDENAIRAAAKEKTLDALSVADARALPYPDCAFNSVLANCALEHIWDVGQVIAEVARVLKPMGVLTFTVPSEHFNNLLFFPRFYRFLGLHSRARRHIQWYNTLQQHYHVDPLSVWEKRLKRVGFKQIIYRYYIPISSTLVFSLWDSMAKWTISLRRSRRVPIQQFLLNPVPNRILFWILYYHLVRYYRSVSNADGGSGLLVVARKE